MESSSSFQGFHYVDYIVFGITIAFSMGIGVYYAFADGKQRTTSEYLMGNHNMKVLPTALSLIVSHESSIVMFGSPAEMYVYGSMYLLSMVGFLLVSVLCTVMFVPILQPLRLISMYEMWYMGIVLYGPGIALQAVTGFPIWASVSVVAGASVFYTCIGGLKAVIWTDVFQSIIMYGGLLAILIKGTMYVGGVSDVLRIAWNNQRLDFFDFNPDPTIRHTFWNLVGGSMFVWLMFTFNQASIQRICSTPTVTTGRQVMAIAIVGFIVMTVMASVQGIVAFAYFTKQRCDPLEYGVISNPNQILPYFVMDVFRSLPGMPGFYIAAVFSACLSTLSSGLCSLSAITWEEMVKPWTKDLSEHKATLIAKLSVIVYGMCAVGLAYLVGNVGDTLTQISVSLLGSSSGPVFGMFLLGMLFPRSNWKGALIGSVVAYAVSLWIALGSNFSPNKVITPWLPPAPSDGCPVANTSRASQWMNETTINAREPQGLEKMYTLSYMWITAVGVLITVFVGIIVSRITGGSLDKTVDPRLIVPISDYCPCLIWRKIKKIFSGGEHPRNKMVISPDDANEAVRLTDINTDFGANEDSSKQDIQDDARR